MRHLEKLLTKTDITSLGDIGKMMLFILPPTGRVLGVYKESDEDRITARRDALLRSGGVCIPFEGLEAFIGLLIGSLNREEHEALAEQIIEAIS